MEQEWLKIDMHTHSQYSKIMKPSDAGKTKNMSAKEFVDTLLEKNVKIFSVTDHNYFSKAFYDEIDKYTENLGIKVINGVEFDAKVDLNDGSKDFIHICIYFDDNVDRDELAKTVHNLYFDATGAEIKPSFVDILNELKKLNSKYLLFHMVIKIEDYLKKILLISLKLKAILNFINMQCIKYLMHLM